MEALGIEHLGQGCLLSLSVTVSYLCQIRKHPRTIFSFKIKPVSFSPKSSSSVRLWPWHRAALERRSDSV